MTGAPVPPSPRMYTRPASRPDPTRCFRPDEARLQAHSLFAAVPIFRDVPPHHLRQLAQAAHRQTFAIADVIIRAGDVGSSMFVIVSGRVEIVLERPSEKLIVAALGPGDVFGELAIFDGERRSATVRAVEETETLTLDHIDIVRVITRSSDLALSLLKALSIRLRTANARLGNPLAGAPPA